MTRSGCRALAVTTGLVLMAGGSALGSPSGVKVRTLAVVIGPSPDEFAATASGAAWIDAEPDCTERIRRIHVLTFGSRPRTLRVRLCSQFENYEPIAFDHGRAVWVRWSAGNTFYEGAIFLAGRGDRTAKKLDAFSFDRGGPDLPWVTVAGDTRGTIIALAGPVLRVVGKRTRHLFDSERGTDAVDVSGNRIGVVLPWVQADVEPRKPPRAELHVRDTGKLLASFELRRAGSIAVSTDAVAIWGPGWIDSYNVSGRLIASRRPGTIASTSGTDSIGIVGRRVVYSRGRGIHAWDPRTGADKVVAMARRPITHFVVTGPRAIWIERLDSRRFAIQAFDIPDSS